MASLQFRLVLQAVRLATRALMFVLIVWLQSTIADTPVPQEGVLSDGVDIHLVDDGPSDDTEGRTNNESEFEYAKPPFVPGDVFRDELATGGFGPDMVVLPKGSFRMGCMSHFHHCGINERPIRDVRIGQLIAMARFETTFDQYDRFTAPRGLVPDQTWGRGNRPVIHVPWSGAQDYSRWLSKQTGARYRLPSEAEWEFAARAGSTTKFFWGDDIGENRSACLQCGSQWDGRRTAPVGSFLPNAFGLHDMHGNVTEWVEDCWVSDYRQAPTDGSPFLEEGCGSRVLRGGSWDDKPWFVRSAMRYSFRTAEISNRFIGFRVVRDLSEWETLDR